MESSSPERQTVEVTILSRQYKLMVADPRETEEVAASVNELMLSIAGKAPNADSTRIAVLACLHLADKLRAAEKQLQSFEDKSERFALLLEEALDHPL